MSQSETEPVTGASGAADDTAEAVPGLLGRYRRSDAAFDEMLAEDGTVRPHYAKIMGAIEDFGLTEMRRRADACQRLAREQGVTFNVHGDPRGLERPWQLDPLPFLIAPDEWSVLEAGLIQRATLLNAILADCYGPQELIRSRWLSPALVFAQPDFLRPCHNVPTAGGTYLHFYAADLARAPDGRWWVVSDRTQIPTGAGYALANRLIASRVLPELFRDNHIQRLAGFFREVKDTLVRLSPQTSRQARIVLLTPGPHNETYFEQALLARYLGYMLVEGQDLTVRDDRVFLKTLSGLEPVDVILRRVDDDFCDPLELRNNSILGVPGLVGALRAGTVSIANALGSGLLQSPAFMSFLPGLCRHVLAEDLLLPSVATWWCGQEPARKYVTEHLDRLQLKAAFRTPAWSGDTKEPFTTGEQETLRRRIEFDPDMFVAQERVELSAAPSWDGTGLLPRPVSLRVFLVAGSRGYHLMPGGLTQVPAGPDNRSPSVQHGGSSKDTWVLSPTIVPEITLLHSEGQSVELRRTGNNLPSRLADHFFWIGRYSERADATTRLLRSAFWRAGPEQIGSAIPLIAPLLQTLELQGQFPGTWRYPEFRRNSEALEAELLKTLFDVKRGGSLRSVVDRLQGLAGLVRDRTSNDMWRVLSRLGRRLAAPVSSDVMLATDAVEVLDETLLGLAAFHGLARENMTRAQAWRFLDMGLRIERAVYLCLLLDATLRSPDADNPSVLEAVLEVADSTITFRSRYNLLPHLSAVFDLVLLDDKNPRSVLFQVNQLAKHFAHLPTDREAVAGSGKSILEGCVAHLGRTDLRELEGAGERWQGGEVSRGIQETLRELPRLSDAIAANYFAHSSISRAGTEGAP